MKAFIARSLAAGSVTALAWPYAMTQWKPKRASTTASWWVTVRHTGIPAACTRAMRLAGEACQYSRSSSRQNEVGVQNGWPSIASSM